LYALWSSKFSTDFGYIQSYHHYLIQRKGYYRIELWGAQGSDANIENFGGRGGYTSGYLYMGTNESLYFYIGGHGNQTTGTDVRLAAGGWNGGGNSAGQSDGGSAPSLAGRIFGAGGGASDVRFFGGYSPNANDLVWNSYLGLNHRIMVAGGGGGAFKALPSEGGTMRGGNGGNLEGQNGEQIRDYWYVNELYCYGEGGTQTNSGLITDNCDWRARSNVANVRDGSGGFGVGGGCLYDDNGATGGGGGYYGGGRSGNVAGGGGGSSFISGYSGCNAIKGAYDRTPSNQANHFTGKVFLSGLMISGARSGDGYGRITYYGFGPFD
jgi:hypothetical protein